MHALLSPLYMIIIVFYATWFLLTIANQFNYGGTILSALNSLLLIPRWTFFAPQPGVHDFHLLYRTESQSGEKSIFKEVPLRESERNISAALWNHKKRVPKILFDLAISINTQASQYRKNKLDLTLLKISFHYLLLLHIVSTYCREKHGEAVQFVIVRTEGHICNEEPDLVFASDFHFINRS